MESGEQNKLLILKVNIMTDFLIEVPHGDDKISCIKAMQVFVNSGSHFLANADWGCADNEHKAWMIVNVANKEVALQIVPPLYRHDTKITKLFKMNRKEVEYYVKEHKLDKTDEYHI